MAIQGGAGSWSEESLLADLPSVLVRRFETVDAAWAAVLDGRVEAAWLAARNSTTGDIAATAGPRRQGAVLLERGHAIEHALLAAHGTRLDDVVRVAGHPQALAQCAATLARLIPRARLEASVDGAHSARGLRPGDATAVVASPRVAARAGVMVLARGVCDLADNTTTFQLLVPRSKS